MDNAMNKNPMILALALDKARGCERIVIGTEYEVRRCLDGNVGCDVMYDAALPLGDFLFSHEKQIDKEWNSEAIYPLKKALVSVLGRKEYEALAWEFLEKKARSCDPICIFSAYQCRRWYLEHRTMLGGEKISDQFEIRIMGLTKSFKQIIWGRERNYSVDQVMERVEQYIGINGQEVDVQARIWYPGRQRKVEFLIIENSFVPAIWYYLNHLRDWGFCFCKCENCGKVFLATSKHYSLCSEVCRKEKNRKNKREFDARARENKYDVDYKNTSQRMRNRVNGVRKKGCLQEKQLALIETAFKSFCAVSVQRKNQIKNHEDYKAFVDWMFEQEREFEGLCETVINDGEQ